MKLSTTFLALLLTISLAQTPTDVACEAVGAYLDAANELAVLEFVYSTSGLNQNVEPALVQVFAEYTPSAEPHTTVFEQYALAIYPAMDGKEYVISVSPLNEDMFLLCGFEMKPQASSSGEES